MNEQTVSRQKKAFLDSFTHSRIAVSNQGIAIESAINSSIRRNPTYSTETTRLRKKEIADFWGKEIVKLSMKYFEKAQSEETFINDVLTLKKLVNNKYKSDLHNKISNGLRIAHCQKSLSVYLKYRWCQGDMVFEPPLCPIDRIVLVHCGRTDVAWTSLDDQGRFRSIIKALADTVKKHPCCNSVAQWELCVFNSIKK